MKPSEQRPEHPASGTKSGGFRAKLLLWTISLVLIPFLVAGYYSYNSSVETLTRLSSQHLDSLAEVRNRYIQSRIHGYEKDLSYLSLHPATSDALAGFINGVAISGQDAAGYVYSYEWEKIRAKWGTGLETFLQEEEYTDIQLMDIDGNLLYSVAEVPWLGENLFSSKWADSRLSKAARQALESGRPTFSDFEWLPGHNSIMGFLMQVVTGEYGEKIGLVLIAPPYEEISDLFTDYRKMGESGKTYLVGEDLLMRSSSRFFKEQAVLKQKVETELSSEWLSSLEQDESKHSGAVWLYPDYRGVEVMGTYAPLMIADKKYMIAAEMDVEEIFAESRTLGYMIIMVVSSALTVSLLLFWWVSRSLTGTLSRSVAELSMASRELGTTMEEQVSTAHQQLSAVSQITTSINQLESTARVTREQVEVVGREAADGQRVVLQGSEKIKISATNLEQIRQQVKEIIDQIERLGERIGEIDYVANFVLDLANQTRLLSVNAAVEAVRADEKGTGFKVVAQEIRLLSEQSKESVRKISKQLSDILEESGNTIQITRNGLQTIEDGVQTAYEISDLFGAVIDTYLGTAESVEHIVSTIQQESDAITQMLQTMEEINRGQNESMTGIEQVRQNIEGLNAVAERLHRMV